MYLFVELPSKARIITYRVEKDKIVYRSSRFIGIKGPSNDIVLKFIYRFERATVTTIMSIEKSRTISRTITTTKKFVTSILTTSMQQFSTTTSLRSSLRTIYRETKEFKTISLITTRGIEKSSTTVSKSISILKTSTPSEEKGMNLMMIGIVAIITVVAIALALIKMRK